MANMGESRIRREFNDKEIAKAFQRIYIYDNLRRSFKSCFGNHLKTHSNDLFLQIVDHVTICLQIPPLFLLLDKA